MELSAGAFVPLLIELMGHCLRTQHKKREYL